jgi:hypothetical protein
MSKKFMYGERKLFSHTLLVEIEGSQVKWWIDLIKDTSLNNPYC